MSISIKIAEEAELFTIEKNAAIIWNEHYGKILKKEQIDYMLSKFQSVGAMKAQIESGYKYYVISDGAFLGYIAIKKEDDRLFLSKLYLLREARGKGIAKKAFEFLISTAKENGLRSIYLTVNKNNLSSIEVYKHLGFKTIREEKADIGCGFYMDDYIMEYNVNETRIALISIIVEDKNSVPKLNSILSEYGDAIIGRMGIPYPKKEVSVISVAIDAPNDTINALSGKLGALSGVNTKTVYSNK